MANTIWNLRSTRSTWLGISICPSNTIAAARPIGASTLKGIKHAVQIDGTLNCSDDVDRGWSVEVAIPWSSMEKYAGTACPPNPGDRWRVNFSRVEWEFERYKGGYLKREGVPCDNWVWSPMGVINMHEPHMWGYVQFSAITVGEGEDAFSATPAARPVPETS